MNINKNFIMLRVGFFTFYLGFIMVFYIIFSKNDSFVPIVAYILMSGSLITFLFFRCPKCKEFIFPYFWNPIRSLELTARILFFREIECPYCQGRNSKGKNKNPLEGNQKLED